MLAARGALLSGADACAVICCVACGGRREAAEYASRGVEVVHGATVRRPVVADRKERGALLRGAFVPEPLVVRRAGTDEVAFAFGFRCAECRYDVGLRGAPQLQRADASACRDRTRGNRGSDTGRTRGCAGDRGAKQRQREHEHYE